MKLILKQQYIDELVQERRNSIANALQLRLSCTKPSICCLSYTANNMPADNLATLKSQGISRHGIDP